MLLQASPHPDAIDWQHRASGNAGRTHNVHRDAASLMLRGLDSAGLTDNMVELYPFLGDNVAAVCTKLKYAKSVASVCSNTNWADGNIVALGGLRDTGNASKKLSTQLNAATALTGKENFTGTHWYTRDTATAGTSQVAIGYTFTTGTVLVGGWVSTGTRESGSIAASSSVNPGGNTTSVAGFHSLQNVNSRACRYYLNGVQVGTVAAAGSGTWQSGQTIQLFSFGTGTYWKRDLLYADLTTGMLTIDCLQLSYVVLQFQTFLNRA